MKHDEARAVITEVLIERFRLSFEVKPGENAHIFRDFCLDPLVFGLLLPSLVNRLFHPETVFFNPKLSIRLDWEGEQPIILIRGTIDSLMAYDNELNLL